MDIISEALEWPLVLNKLYKILLQNIKREKIVFALQMKSETIFKNMIGKDGILFVVLLKRLIMLDLAELFIIRMGFIYRLLS